jgi:hypothetical protein
VACEVGLGPAELLAHGADVIDELEMVMHLS